MEKVWNCPAADVCSETNRSPNVHRFHAAAIVHGEECIAITKHVDWRGVRNDVAVRVESGRSGTLNSSRGAVTDLGRQSTNAGGHVRAETSIQELALTKIPCAVNVVQEAHRC